MTSFEEIGPQPINLNAHGRDLHEFVIHAPPDCLGKSHSGRGYSSPRVGLVTEAEQCLRKGGVLAEIARHPRPEQHAMPAAVEAKFRRTTTYTNAAGISSAIVPVEVRHRSQPRKKFAFDRSFPTIHGDVEGTAINNLSVGIGIAKKSVAALRDLPPAHGSENQEGEDDRAGLTQQTLLNTEELRMPQGYLPDAKAMLDLHGWYRASFLGFFTVSQKKYAYSETEVLFLALSSHEGMFCSGRSCKE